MKHHSNNIQQCIFSIAELKNAFSTFDKNADGFISKQELAEGMSNLGHIISSEELDDIIKAVDIDGKCKTSLNFLTRFFVLLLV